LSISFSLSFSVGLSLIVSKKSGYFESLGPVQ